MSLSPFVSYIVIALLLHVQPSRVENPERIETVRSYKLEFFENGKTYETARTECEARDAWLVEIKDEELFQAVYGLKLHLTIWIGAYYSSEWTWNGKDSLRYANWSPDNPSVVEERFKNKCGFMSGNGQWKNTDCTKNVRYVCQTDLNYPGSFSLTFVTTPKKSFNDAKTACTAMTASSSRLVEIKTSALNSFINRNISGETVQYWTSGNDDVTEGEWKWGDGNSISTSSSNWIASADGTREPSGASEEDCLATNITGWADELCRKTNGYICQENITSGQCEEEVCSNRGNCEISNKRYTCSCNAGYFGTKCEKDLITISLPTRSTTVHRGESLTVTVTVMSYDGNVKVSYRKGPDGSPTDKQITISHVGASATTQLTLGSQLTSALHYFVVRSVTQPSEYSRTANINVTIIGYCGRFPCMNGGTCNDIMSEPYYTCTCKFENEGLKCEKNRSFVAIGNCKYHMRNETFDFVNATKTCARLDKEGSLAMTKNPNITNFLGEAIRSQFKIVDQWLWVGGEQFKHDWFWLDGTTINNTAPWQIWDNREHQYLIVRLPSEGEEMRWSSKNGSETAEGYICEVPVQSPCNLTNCANGGICVSVGCQASCNCTPGFDGDLCENEKSPETITTTMVATATNTIIKQLTTSYLLERSTSSSIEPTPEMTTTAAVETFPPSSVEQLSTPTIIIILLSVLLLISMIGNVVQAVCRRNAKAKSPVISNKPDEYDHNVNPYETTFMGRHDHHYENSKVATNASVSKDRSHKQNTTPNDAYEMTASTSGGESSPYESPFPPHSTPDTGYEEYRPPM